MKDIFSKIILITTDFLMIILSIIAGFYLRVAMNGLFEDNFRHMLVSYVSFPLIYIITISVFAYEGIYTKRYDFWHESKQIIKSLFMSFVVVMAYLAITKTINQYSRAVFIFAFLTMMFLIPLSKYILKYLLYKIGLWKKKVKIYDKCSDLRKDIMNNPYMGYCEGGHNCNSAFINSKNYDIKDIRMIIENELKKHSEINFVPPLNDYDLTHSGIYFLFNTRTNLIVFKNRLKSFYMQILQSIFNYFLAIILLPLLLPIIAIIGIFIKRESPGPIFFAHNRVGKNNKIIPTLKFRSMYVDAEERLRELLEKDPKIKKEWEENFKLKNDPRVTKIGSFLRKTSLDELPQIFNVLRGEMNFVGPRPVVQEEIDKYYRDDAQYYYMVKPGITGLWQVSGRSDTDYDFRIKTDKWYVKNWSLWLDIVILFKTIIVVAKKDGAY